MILRNLLFIFITFQILLVNSEDSMDLTYEIEVLIYATPENITDEKFILTNYIEVTNNEVVELTTPEKKINLKALNESFNYEYKFGDIFKNILSIRSNDDEKSFSNNSGFWYRDLDNGKSLASIKRRISRRNDFKYLGHFTWHQGALNSEKSPYVRLSNDTDFELYVKTYKSRYLHIDLKGFLKNELLKDDRLTNYYINKDIRVFPNEIYYFDHPKFGVLVSIKDKP